VQTNIYAEKDNGDLRLIAEIEGLDDPALAVDALLDEMPRLKQRDFVVINLDNVMKVEAGEDIIQPRRQITIRGGNSSDTGTAPAPKRRRAPKAESGENGNGDETEEASPKPAPRRRGRPPGSKNKKTKAPAKKGSPFRANPSSSD
jgi:hypothetical protein